MKENNLTAEYVRSLLLYIPETGKFIWRSSGKGHQALAKAGRVNDCGYRTITINQKSYYAHRLAWLWHYGEWPPGNIDHKNLVRSDNRICNLRIATYSQNSFNRKLISNNTSGYQGVHWDKKSQRWRAIIKIAGKRTCLGQFKLLEDAASTYKIAADLHYGEFVNSHSVFGGTLQK